eukprot:EG_transcript_49072
MFLKPHAKCEINLPRFNPAFSSLGCMIPTQKMHRPGDVRTKPEPTCLSFHQSRQRPRLDVTQQPKPTKIVMCSFLAHMDQTNVSFFGDVDVLLVIPFLK